VSSTTQFQIGSETKLLTAALLAAGKVHLSDPLLEYVPAGFSLPWNGGSEITIGELATHTAGLAREPPGLDKSKPFA
jgi:CubicO group peptidase (beta-lactamase class C family)